MSSSPTLNLTLPCALCHSDSFACCQYSIIVTQLSVSENRQCFSIILLRVQCTKMAKKMLLQRNITLSISHLFCLRCGKKYACQDLSLEGNRAIPQHEFGFCKHFFTFEQVHRVKPEIRQALEKKEYCSAEFLDIQQAQSLLCKIKNFLPHSMIFILALCAMHRVNQARQ